MLLRNCTAAGEGLRSDSTGYPHGDLWLRELVSGILWVEMTPEDFGFLLRNPRAHNSAVECHLHTVEVVGSNPAVPTI